MNAANSSTFCLMVVTGLLTPTMIHLTNIRWVLVFGTMGYAPYAASLYTHQKYGTEWFVVLGAVLCGISAGAFWASEGAVILAVSRGAGRGSNGLSLTLERATVSRAAQPGKGEQSSTQT